MTPFLSFLQAIFIRNLCGYYSSFQSLFLILSNAGSMTLNISNYSCQDSTSFDGQLLASNPALIGVAFAFTYSLLFDGNHGM